MFRFFDRDNDGLLDFEDFLQLCLPVLDMQLRAKASQRMNYEVNQSDRLQHNVEFELSRLLEKEIHFHIKVEIEKKELENAEDFSTVAVFTCMDALNYGYLDFDQLRNYYAKFKGEVLKEDINAMMRRMSNSLDSKITFREFSVAITPELNGLGASAETVEFHTEQKQQQAEDHMQRSINRANKNRSGVGGGEINNSLRVFRPINNE